MPDEQEKKQTAAAQNSETPPAEEQKTKPATENQSPDPKNEDSTLSTAETTALAAKNAEVATAYEQITRDKATLTSYYDELLGLPFQKGIYDNELVDIVKEYGWTSERGMVKKNTPYLIAVERKQKVNSSIMNYVNLFYSSAAAGKDIQDKTFGTTVANSNAANVVISGGKTVAGLISSGAKKVIQWVQDSGAKGFGGDPTLNGFLSPYKYLYHTEETHKKFHFPMMNNGEAYLSLQGQWSSESQATDVINNFLATAASKVAESYLYAATDVAAINQVATMERGNIQQAYIEKAKAYNFPEEGQTVRVQFPLFNTVEKDIWKKHYQFLFLFAVRNLPYKITPYSYFPPLLYDLILPGYKRLPLCYVSNFNVQQQGVVRMLTIEDFLGTISDRKEEMGDDEGAKAIIASIPDAWLVTIEFKSLLAPSANLMLQTQHTRVNIIAAGAGEEGQNWSQESRANGNPDAHTI